MTVVCDRPLALSRDQPLAQGGEIPLAFPELRLQPPEAIYMRRCDSRTASRFESCWPGVTTVRRYRCTLRSGLVI
jgi:hypothetical protein